MVQCLVRFSDLTLGSNGRSAECIDDGNGNRVVTNTPRTPDSADVLL
jgi:hypothetical protein